MLASLELKTLRNRDQPVSSRDCSVSTIVVLREQHHSREKPRCNRQRERNSRAEPSTALNAAIGAAPGTAMVAGGSLMQRTLP